MTELQILYSGQAMTFAGILIITIINIKSNRNNEHKKSHRIDLKEELNSKVSQKIYDSAMKRIGIQVDTNTEEIKDKSKSIHKLENGMAFMVGKMGGNWKTIKDTGLDLG